MTLSSMCMDVVLNLVLVDNSYLFVNVKQGL